MLGEAPIGPPPKSPVGRLIGAASVHLPRAGAVSFDERDYPVPNPRHLSRFSRRADSIRRQPISFCDHPGRIPEHQTRQLVPAFGWVGAPGSKASEGEVGPLMTVSTG